MKEKKNSRSILIVALIMVVIGLSVAYAVLSQQLTINGVGKIKGSTWKILFANLAEPTLSGNAEIDEEAKIINNSTTITFAVSLKQPGDSVTYTFDVKNEGTINAEVNAVSLIGVTEAKAADVTYTLTYSDGKPISVGDSLLSEEVKNLILTVAYDSSADTVPAEDIVLDLGATITYIQM